VAEGLKGFKGKRAGGAIFPCLGMQGGGAPPAKMYIRRTISGQRSDAIENVRHEYAILLRDAFHYCAENQG